MDKFTPEIPATAETTEPPGPKTRTELRNSLWCKDDQGRLGMIGEMQSAEGVRFYYAGADGTLEPEFTIVDHAKLKIAKASDLPAHLGYTPAQAADIGYTS